MRDKRTTAGFSAALADILCSALASCGLLFVALQLVGLDSSIWQCAPAALAAALLLWLLSRRWWLLPAVLGGAGLLFGGLMHGLTLFDVHLWPGIYEWCAGFWDWCLQAWPVSSPYASALTLTAVRTVAALPLAALTLLYFRRLFFLPLQPAALMALLIYMDKTHMPGMSSVAATALPVMLCSLARWAAKRTERARRVKCGRGVVQIAALALTVAALLPACLIAPRHDYDAQSGGLVRLVYQINSLIGYRQGVSGSGSFTIAGSGFAPSGEELLGGDVAPNDDVVLSVTASSPVLLSGKVYDTYSGRGWSDSMVTGDFLWQGTLFSGKRRGAFALDKPADPRARYLYASLAPEMTVTVTPKLSGSTVFTAGRVNGVELARGGRFDVSFNLQGELFTDKSSRTAYRLNISQFDRAAEGFDQDFLRLEAMTSGGRDSYYSDYVEPYCLALPDSLPRSVRDAVSSVVGDIDDPYLKARAIEDWLGEVMTYTLTPGSLPDGSDLVSWFLKAKTGYCVYYASAMTVMARCAGLPARYCTGYALTRDPDRVSASSYLATNSTAHAWCEIYFKGIGWVQFDPLRFYTGSAVTLEPTAPAETTDTAPAATPTAPDPVIPTPEPLPDVPIAPPEPEPEKGASPLILFITGGALLLALIIWLALTFGGEKNYYRRLTRRYGTPARRLDAAFTRLLRQLTLLGVYTGPDATMATVSRAGDELFRSGAVSAAVLPVQEHRYAGRSVREMDVIVLTRCCAQAEALLREKLGLGRYVLHRLAP